MGLKTENSDYCDRTNCILHRRLRRCGFVHADISARSPQRAKKASDSIQQQTGENQSHECFDGAQFAALGPCRVIFQFADSSAVFGGLNVECGASLASRRDEHKFMSFVFVGLHREGRFGGLKSRQLSILTSTFFDTSIAPLPLWSMDSRVCCGAKQRGFGKSVAISKFRNRVSQ